MIWITGGTSGLGYYVGLELKKKYKVGIIGRDPIKLKDIEKRGLFDQYFCCDVENYEAVKGFWRYLSANNLRCNSLICNVGSGNASESGSEDQIEWQRMLSKNLFSTINMVDSGTHIFEKDTTKIICISSICGIDYVPGAPITYSVAKAALNAYVRIKHRQFKNTGPVIIGLALGNMIFSGSTWENKSSELREKIIEEEVSVKRFGTPKDVSEFIDYVLGSGNFIQGQIFTLDGGQTRKI